MKGYQSKTDPRMVSSPYTPPVSAQYNSGQPQTHEQLESLKNMKKIWKKAVFSIKKESKQKPIQSVPSTGMSTSSGWDAIISPSGLNSQLKDINTPASSTPDRTTQKKSSSSDIDPIYLMLKSAAIKNTDEPTETPIIKKEDKSFRQDDFDKQKDYTKENPSSSSLLSNTSNITGSALSSTSTDKQLVPPDNHRKLKESTSTSRIMGSSSHRRRLDHRMKSQSIDNAETEQPTQNVVLPPNNTNNTNTDYLLTDYGISSHSKQLSNSYSNTYAIDNTTQSSSGIHSSSSTSMRRKYMMEQHRSISMEHEHSSQNSSSGGGGVGTTGYYDSSNMMVSSNSNHRSNSSITSPKQSTRYIASGSGNSDDSKRNSQTSVTKVNLRSSRGNWKMKSFSVDIPDGDQEMSPTTSQNFHKSNSHTSSPIRERPRISSQEQQQTNSNPYPNTNLAYNTQQSSNSASYHHQYHSQNPQKHTNNTTQNPSSSSSASHYNRSSYTNLNNATGTTKSAQSSQRSSRSNYGGGNNNSGGTKHYSNINIASSDNFDYQDSSLSSSNTTRRQINPSYVVVQDFYARRSDEIDLKAGWRVEVLKCTDPEWWTGRCNGRVGYFPSACVQRYQHGDCVWKMVRDIGLEDDDGNYYNLRKGDIVVQQGQQSGDNLPICIKKISYVWCPIDYVGKIFDDYI